MRDALLLVSLAMGLALGQSACSRHGDACVPWASAPMVPFANATVSGTLTYSLDGATSTMPAGDCSLSIDGVPDRESLYLDCGRFRVQSALEDLRGTAVGAESRDFDITVFYDGTYTAYLFTTTTQGTLTITQASGTGTSASPYVTADFVRTGSMTLDVDGDTATWASPEYPSKKPKGFSLKLDLDFSQTAASYGEKADPSPCNFDGPSK